MNRNHIWSRVVYSAGVLMAAMILYGIWIEPDQVGIHHIWIQDRYWEHVFRNKVVVQISDLHIKAMGKREQKVLDILDELQPDIIFLTGDYVAWNGNYEPALKFLSRLHAKIGIWAVMGDYDYSNSRKSCIFCHEEGSGKPTLRHSVRFLRDNSEVLNLSEGGLTIAGIDRASEHSLKPKGTFIAGDNKLPVLVLSHSPLAFDFLRDDLHMLMLAGDTHGGQVPFPSWIFSMLGYQKNALYSEGVFEKGEKKMFVSRGIGTSHFPIRFFRRPEVVVLHFSY